MATTKYIWDEQNYLAEADATDTINVVYTNEPKAYGDLISTRIANTASYHTFDALGSTCALTSSSGRITDTYIYDISGRLHSREGSTSVRLLWIGLVGYYADHETLLIYVRRRYYEPSTARWMAADPAEHSAGVNRYLYVRNRTASGQDPSGLIEVQFLRDNLGEIIGAQGCGKQFEVHWNFVLDKPANCKPLAGRKPFGYIVQKSSIFLDAVACTPPCPTDVAGC